MPNPTQADTKLPESWWATPVSAPRQQWLALPCSMNGAEMRMAVAARSAAAAGGDPRRGKTQGPHGPSND